MEFSLTEFEPVADRVYVAVAQPESVNIGLVVGTTGALVIDTGSSPAQGEAIRAAAQAIAADVPLTHVVVTHGHDDHIGGLAAFADLVSIGHRDLPGLTKGIGLAAAIDLGDCHAEVIHYGRGHTENDVTAVVPQRAVAFFGDLLESAGPPQVDELSWPAEWPKSLDGTLGALQKGYVVVPGHGPVMDREDAFVQRAELHWHHDKAIEAHDAGRTASEAAAQEGWHWSREATEAYLTRALARIEQSGRPRKKTRTLPLLNR